MKYLVVHGAFLNLYTVYVYLQVLNTVFIIFVAPSLQMEAQETFKTIFKGATVPPCGKQSKLR